MKKLSQKQIDFAKVISYALQIELPQEFSAKAYWEFISSNICQYQQLQSAACDRNNDHCWFAFEELYIGAE